MQAAVLLVITGATFMAMDWLSIVGPIAVITGGVLVGIQLDHLLNARDLGNAPVHLESRLEAQGGSGSRRRAHRRASGPNRPPVGLGTTHHAHCA